MTRPPRLGNHALHLLDLGLGPSKGAELCVGGGCCQSDEEATQHNITHYENDSAVRSGGTVDEEDGYGSSR